MQARLLLRWFVPMVLGLYALLASRVPASAQTAPSARESAVKAAFLYKFAAFVEWPPGTFQRPDQPLVIGVSGADDIADDLEQLVAGRSDKRPVTVRRVHDDASMSGVHVLFVASRREARLREALDAVKGPVLLVTEQPGALRLGSVLNFSEQGGRVRFGASLTSAEAHNLKLSARLLAVAYVVEGRR
jgi:hypothetical protein